MKLLGCFICILATGWLAGKSAAIGEYDLSIFCFLLAWFSSYCALCLTYEYCWAWMPRAYKIIIGGQGK